MRFFVDAQLPPGLVEFLEKRGHEAKAVHDVRLREAQDRAIWAFAVSGDWDLFCAPTTPCDALPARMRKT
jgi:predicted nuclease of predicted toxin-antitoxin system